MATPASADIVLPASRFEPEQEVLALAEQTLRMVLVAQVLASSARVIDVDGLQRQVGYLCARALDLPPGRGGFAKLELRRLVSGLDTLHATLRSQSA